VNNLLFDLKRLLDNMEMRDTFDQLLNLKKQLERECSVILKSVNFSVSVSDFNEQFESIRKAVQDLDHAQFKSEVMEILSNMKKELEQIDDFSKKYADFVVEENTSIQKENLEEEKRKCLKRRDYRMII